MPPLDAGMGYPDEPAAESLWRLAGPVQNIASLRPGEPHVARFEWIPGLHVRRDAALLAIATNNQDALAALPVGTATADFIRDHSRAALRVTPVNRTATVYIRDGVDDRGPLGAVAWGGRCPDIIVVTDQNDTPDDPTGDFADLMNPRITDHVAPGDNHIYVRVSNGTRLAINANVQVYAVPANAPVPVADWTQIGDTVTIEEIAPRSWGFAHFPWPGVVDPDPSNPTYKAFTLVAIAQPVDPVTEEELDPYPDQTAVADIDSFWRFFINAERANNAAVRSLRFRT